MKSGEFKLVRFRKEKLAILNPDVYGIFKKRAEAGILGMAEYYREVDKKTQVKVICEDSAESNGLKKNSVDLIITSPPYGDSRTTVAYGQFSRLSLQWLWSTSGDQLRIDNELLGGKSINSLERILPSRYLKIALATIAKIDDRRADEVLSFYIGLNECLKRAFEILKPEKYFCVVIGNRTVKGIKLPTDFIVAELGQKIGFETVDLFVRNIPNKRIPLRNSPTNVAGKLEETMTKESIVILKKAK